MNDVILTSNSKGAPDSLYVGDVHYIRADKVYAEVEKLNRIIQAGNKAPGNETGEQLGCFTAERDAARLVARKRLELLVEAGIVGGECEGCQMGYTVVNGYHEHGPSGIRIKCNAAESVGKDESGACAHCSHYHQNEFLPYKCCHCGSEKARCGHGNVADECPHPHTDTK